MNPVTIGDQAPDFTATASDGVQITLSEFRGKKAVVLFFYPRDNSPICTTEACAFRDAYEDFASVGAEVIGVSSDSDDSHRQFASDQRLPFRLISDSDGSLRRLFGVPKSLFVLPGRVTYVIDQAGFIRHIFNSQLAGTRHVQEAIDALRRVGGK